MGRGVKANLEEVYILDYFFFGFPKRTFLLKLINMVKYSNQSKHIFSLNSGIKKQKIHFWLFRTKTPKTPISLFFSTLSAEKFNNRNLSKLHKNIFLLAGISIQGSLTNINPPQKKITQGSQLFSNSSKYQNTCQPQPQPQPFWDSKNFVKNPGTFGWKEK